MLIQSHLTREAFYWTQFVISYALRWWKVKPPLHPRCRYHHFVPLERSLGAGGSPLSSQINVHTNALDPNMQIWNLIILTAGCQPYLVRLSQQHSSTRTAWQRLHLKSHTCSPFPTHYTGTSYGDWLVNLTDNRCIDTKQSLILTRWTNLTH